MIRILVVFVAIALIFIPAMCTAAVLEVVVVGLKNQNGDVHIAIYNTAEHFPYQEGVLHEAKAPILGNVARLKFKDLTPGAYAVVEEAHNLGLYASGLQGYQKYHRSL